MNDPTGGTDEYQLSRRDFLVVSKAVLTGGSRAGCLRRSPKSSSRGARHARPECKYATRLGLSFEARRRQAHPGGGDEKCSKTLPAEGATRHEIRRQPDHFHEAAGWREARYAARAPSCVPETALNIHCGTVRNAEIGRAVEYDWICNVSGLRLVRIRV